MKRTISMVSFGMVAFERRADKGLHHDLFDFLESDGFLLTSRPHGDFLIALDHNEELYKAFLDNGGSSERSVLIRLEPDSVFPAQHINRIKSKYGLIITPGSVSDWRAGDFFAGWPYQYHLNPAKPDQSDPTLSSMLENPAKQDLFTIENWKARPIGLTMVAANKVSPLRGANYSVRRNLANRIPASVLHVYGPLWKDGLRTKMDHRLWVAKFALRHGTFPNLIGIYGRLFASYPAARGTVRDKHVVLQDSKFSLVIENSNSYVSEKLIDAIINGCIPIYIGPHLQDVGLPSNIAIVSSGDPKEIMNIIETLDWREAESILVAIQGFLKSPLFWNLWTAESVWKIISTEITNYFGRLAR